MTFGPMTIQQLACFRATAREGSFSAAARVLHLSQPALSEQVRRLESGLNRSLITRSGRGVALTPEGRTFLVHAERVLAAAEEAFASIDGPSEGSGQVLTLGLTRNAPYYPIADLVQRALKALPELSLRLPGYNSSLVTEAVRKGEIEAALVILPVDSDGLNLRHLFRDEVLFVSADSGRTRHPAEIEDIASGSLILYDTGAGFMDPTRRQLAARAQEAGIPLSPRFDVEHPETALQLAASGLGDTIAPRALSLSPAFPAELSTDGFAEPLFDDFALITRSGPFSSALETLLEIIAEWAGRISARYQLAVG